MQPERSGPRQTSLDSIARLAETLFDLAGDQDVRVIEALAAVLARQWRDGPGSLPRGLSEAPAARPFAHEASDPDAVIRRAICQRIARRALHGSLVDPTRGATVVHRIDDSPAWSRDLLPIGMFGPFLFYRPPPRWRAGDWPTGRSPSQQQIARLDQ
jgi:N-acetylmuramoyl-L-alanine amidase